MKSILSVIHGGTMPISMAFVVLFVSHLLNSSLTASIDNEPSPVKGAIYGSAKNADNGTITMFGPYSTFRKAKLFGGLNLLFNLSIGRPGTSPDRIIPGFDPGRIQQACNILQNIKKLAFDLLFPRNTTPTPSTTASPATTRSAPTSARTSTARPVSRPTANLSTIRPPNIP